MLGPSEYSYLTSKLLLGWNELSEGKPGAREHFDEVLASLNWASWLYVAEALFGIACHALLSGSDGKDRIYQWLVQAQYVYVLLGLQGMPHTLLPAKLGIPNEVSCFPGHLLTSGAFSDLSPERRLILRTDAIGEQGQADWLYRSLQELLCGRSGSRNRIAMLQNSLD
jgi:hypothetical protein